MLLLSFLYLKTLTNIVALTKRGIGRHHHIHLHKEVITGMVRSAGVNLQNLAVVGQS